ncbi:MAG TPA: hypothetical protein VFR09_01780 [Alphaproteobacteria bacterium]|nr:hypothetical protein [Alphaproteobacteria bacterium]
MDETKFGRLSKGIDFIVRAFGRTSDEDEAPEQEKEDVEEQAIGDESYDLR